MTTHRDLETSIRERQSATGESYTAARMHVMRERTAPLGQPEARPIAGDPLRVDAAVLKVNRRSARVRVLGQARQITFRSRDIGQVVPGHLVTLSIDKRWTWNGDDYASGRIENPRIAIDKLALTPLPLRNDGLEDLRTSYEAFRGADARTPLWHKPAARLRPSFVMDPIAWGRFPGAGEADNPTCDAAGLARAGQTAPAHEMLMDVLGTDLRCIDAHAHLGSLEFDHAQMERAMAHYEIGMRIGELSLPPGFDGMLLWAHIDNRPFLRCLHGYALCLWRLGELRPAERIFERLLSLNPHDNQGVRFCWDDVRHGRRWDEGQAQQALGHA